MGGTRKQTTRMQTMALGPNLAQKTCLCEQRFIATYKYGHLFIIFSNFYATKTQFSSCDRDYTAH